MPASSPAVHKAQAASSASPHRASPAALCSRPSATRVPRARLMRQVGTHPCHGRINIRAQAASSDAPAYLHAGSPAGSPAVASQAVLWKEYVEEGVPALDNFELAEVAVPALHEGEVLVELVYLSMDSFTRGRMRSRPILQVPPFPLGKPLVGPALGRVVLSRDDNLPEGVLVTGMLQWQQQQVVASSTLHVVDEQVLRDKRLPASVYLGVLGTQGLAAYASLALIGKPKPGDTVFVSGAAGSIGLTLGQLCKHVYGCSNVVGAVSSDDKVELLRTYGFDAAFNVKDTNIVQALAQSCPRGIDVFFDNTGGAMLQPVLEICNLHARVIACGTLSQFNDAPGARFGVTNLFNVVTRRITIKGFLAQDHQEALRPQFLKDMTRHLHAGQVRPVEHLVTGGLPAAPTAFLHLMNGLNTGKVVVQCGMDPYRRRGSVW